jgi:Protein of unknown function DUF2625
MTQTLHELTTVDDPAGPLLHEWLDAGKVETQVLDVEPDRRDQCLVGLQVTLRSVLGALAYDTGGVVVDHGWLRLLGGGHGALPSLYEALGLDGATQAPAYVVLGWDVVGGVFALDGGGLRGVKGHVCYYAPDALQWEDLEFGHAEFVRWALAGGLTTFAGDLRWEGWEAQAPGVPLDEVYLSDPPLWTPEGQEIDEAARRRVRVDELLAHHGEAAAAMPHARPGDLD